MPLEAKPLFRPDVLRTHVGAYMLPERVAAEAPKLTHWAELISSRRADSFKEQEILPDFLTDFFCGVLGYTRPADGGPRYTISREKHVEVDGKFADAVLGHFGVEGPLPTTNPASQYLVALEGKGPRDPLDRPFAGRRMSAVDQAYRYAINLPCDWIVVTSVRETRLYYKGADQHTYERFDTERLADDALHLKRFVFLLGAERVVPTAGRCHLYSLWEESQKVGRELTRDFYQRYAEMRQSAFEELARDNPTAPRGELLSATQKLLDRVLFCAFCEDRGLLPVETIRKAYEHRDPYHPRPVWDNFRGLFDSINGGNAALGIHAYNGGLFAPDAVVDSLLVSDRVCSFFRDLGAYDYRPASQAAESAAGASLIDVEILGHIFEQSISDLEKLRSELTVAPTLRGGDAVAADDRLSPPSVAPTLRGGDAVAADDRLSPPSRSAAPTSQTARTRRKKEGAFYTPAFITRYIIEQALGGVLKDRFARLRREHEEAAPKKGPARTALADPNVYKLDDLKPAARAALVKFWESWQDELGSVRLLDPACGSGAFLIEAFDQLHAAYQASNDRLQELRGHRTLFDLDKRILENNLYGVDLNEEAIEICRLSLWIKTAERGKVLTSLDHTIRVGNSVVSDPAVHPRAFDWHTAFPEVFAGGGFDVVVGNPPYIRQELLGDFKDHWKERFGKVFASTADIYVYFFGLGTDLLRPGGRLAFISSSSFARANYAYDLRAHLLRDNILEQFIDLGDTQVFEDAKDVYPAIIVLRKPVGDVQPLESRSIRTIRLRRSDDAALLSELIEARASKLPAASLATEGWQFDEPEVLNLRGKLRRTTRSLSDYAEGKFYLGIKTALNEAFVIDDGLRGSIKASDPQSAAVIKPFVGGQDIRRWYREDSGAWLILFANGSTSSACGSKDEVTAWDWVRKSHPAIAEHLARFERQARKRQDKGEFWWELRACDYYDTFEKPKILYPDIAKSNRFCYDSGGLYSSNTTYFLPLDDWYLLGVLNSKATWFALAGISVPFGERAGEYRYRLFSQYLAHLPIPDAPAADRELIAALARRCTAAATERHALDIRFQHRLTHAFGYDSAGASLGKLNQKAQAWSDATLTSLGAALKASFKLRSNPFANPRSADEWEPYLNEHRAKVDAMTRQLADAEAELNERVFRLFALNSEEIELLQREVEH